MDYRFEVMALPPSQHPAVQGMDPAAEQPSELQPPHQDDARPWAGDAYDEGDETDPAQAYASFSGSNGEQAWLDKAEDGTLTGWVRDESGQVWRYSDPDTWAIDVDDAGMAQSGGTGDQPDPASQDPAAQDPAMQGQDPAASRWTTAPRTKLCPPARYRQQGRTERGGGGDDGTKTGSSTWTTGRTAAPAGSRPAPNVA